MSYVRRFSVSRWIAYTCSRTISFVHDNRHMDLVANATRLCHVECRERISDLTNDIGLELFHLDIVPAQSIADLTGREAEHTSRFGLNPSDFLHCLDQPVPLCEAR